MYLPVESTSGNRPTKTRVGNGEGRMFGDGAGGALSVAYAAVKCA